MSEIRSPDFEYICEVVRREAAIVLEPGKEYLAQNRLQPVAKDAGFADIGALVDRLRCGDRALVGRVVDALTTNETSFFRDGHPWDAVRDHLLPELLEKRRLSRQINVWFAAASSGQEPYTFAMMLQEHFRTELRTFDFRLHGTDISPSMIDRCRSGKYSQLEVNRGLPASLMVRYLDREGMSFVVSRELRDMFTFELLNLADPSAWTRLPTFDLIFVRNVLIYFDLDMKRQILCRLRRQIQPDGVLMLGASETAINLSDEFSHSQVGKTTCYRPVSTGPVR